ncbi:MAG: hypothetical protein R8G66_23245 [Cytophagales bacterium]|nr:hypothetical protein [Cytophagales bacterium]
MDFFKYNFRSATKFIFLLGLVFLCACKSDNSIAPEEEASIVMDMPNDSTGSVTDSVQLIEHKLMINLFQFFPDAINLFRSERTNGYFLTVRGRNYSSAINRVFHIDDSVQIDWNLDVTPIPSGSFGVQFYSNDENQRLNFRKKSSSYPEGLIISEIGHRGLINVIFELSEPFGFASSNLPPVSRLGELYVLSWVNTDHEAPNRTHRVIGFNSAGIPVWQDEFPSRSNTYAKMRVFNRQLFYAYKTLDESGANQLRLRIYDENGQVQVDFFLYSELMGWNTAQENVADIIVEDNILYVLSQGWSYTKNRIAKYDLTGELLREIEFGQRLTDFDLNQAGLWSIGNDFSHDPELTLGNPFILKLTRDLEILFQSEIVDITSRGGRGKIVTHENGMLVAGFSHFEDFSAKPYVISLDNEGQIVTSEK